VRTSSKTGAALTIAALQDRAMVAGIVAGQLGEQLAHIVAQIEMIDHELAKAAPSACDAVRERREQRRCAALRQRRAQLECMRVEAARFADCLRAERAGLLRRVIELQRRSALALVPAPDATLPDTSTPHAR
jgi:hypothetical protein